MSQKLLLLLLVISLGLLLYTNRDRWFDKAQTTQESVARSETSALRQEPLPEMHNYVADISVHSVEALSLLFDRVESLSQRPHSDQESPLVSLVLHGPEVKFFALKNYQKYKSLVDRAAKLEALGAVNISICQTKMRRYGIQTEEVPAFLKQVPYGPDEVKRLLKAGYVYM